MTHVVFNATWHNHKVLFFCLIRPAGACCVRQDPSLLLRDELWLSGRGLLLLNTGIARPPLA
eukprot:6779963-Prymnesium_polylepis.2